MKRNILLHAALLIALLFTPAVIIPTGSIAAREIQPEKVSSQLKYSGYSSPGYKSFTKSSQYVKMSDGVKLAVDVYIPAEGPENKSFPVVFQYTPYSRSVIHPRMSWIERTITKMKMGTSGPVFDYSLLPASKMLLSHGYVLVVADMRGTGASYGWQFPFMRRLGDDGGELVNWIASQKWCNGRVGMMGQSYLAWSQLATAKKKPKALKCIMPEVIAFTGYTEGLRPGGIAAQRWIDFYSEYLNGYNMSFFNPKYKFKFYPCAPVIDEDGDGDLADEVPLMDRGDPASFLDDSPPKYRDGVARKSIYYNAVRQHASNMTFKEGSNRMAYIDSIYKDFNTYESSPGYFAREVMEFDIPMYHIGGWFDGFTVGTSKLYASMAGKNPSKLLFAPRFHMPWITKPYEKFFSYQGDFKLQLQAERLRFFDRYLKGIDNGIDREPPVYIYVMNEGWRAEREWPLKRQVLTSYFLSADKKLSKGRSPKGSDLYKVDFTHSSSYGSNDVSRWVMMYTPDKVMKRTEKDKKCLIYDTEALPQDVEVTGHPIVEIYVSSNRPDGDFYAYLVDVDAGGESMYVTEGWLRAGWKKLHNPKDQIKGVVDVKPVLPWHGYKKGGYEKNPLAGGKVISLRFDLMPTSWLFKKGHRIRLAVAGADTPDFEINPALSPENDPKKALETIVTMHRSDAFPSRIELPVIPRK